MGVSIGRSTVGGMTILVGMVGIIGGCVIIIETWQSTFIHVSCHHSTWRWRYDECMGRYVLASICKARWNRNTFKIKLQNDSNQLSPMLESIYCYLPRV